MNRKIKILMFTSLLLIGSLGISNNNKSSIDYRSIPAEFEYSNNILYTKNGLPIWTIIVDGEPVLEIAVARNVDIDLENQYVIFYTDFIFKNGFE